MTKKKQIKRILLDLDGIIVDMLGPWLRQYEIITGEKIPVSDIVSWDATIGASYPEVLNSLLEKPGFFRNLPPMPGAQKYLSKLIEENNHEIIILTQPPRKSDYAVRDKRLWMQDYFPNFDITNMIYAHKKYLVRGDVLFDDKPSHLALWKHENPESVTATIDYPYNRNDKSDWRWGTKNAWRCFYEAIKKNS